MATFLYYGRDSNGVAVNGEVDRSTENDVAAYLSKNKITPIKIEEATKGSSDNNLLSGSLIRSVLFTKKVTDEELIMFCRQMYTINKAGMPLMQGLDSLAGSIEDGTLKDCIIDLGHRLEHGISLSAAMKHHRHIFNRLFIGMVKIGEGIGNLDAIFLQMSVYIARDVETRKAIKSAMRYPTFVLCAMVVALFVVNLMVIPAFADMFNRFGAELPLPTKILLATSNFFVNYWWLVIIAMVAAVGGLIYWVNTEEGRYYWHKFKLKTPIIGVLVNKAAMSRYVRSFSLMISAGLPLNKAIGLCAEIIDNSYLAVKIKKIKTDIERGDSIYRTHMRSEMFSPLVLQMINIGENSGQIDTLLMEVAESYEREVDYDLESLSSKIEPLLILVMAGFVVVLALGIFLPMWDMFSIQ